MGNIPKNFRFIIKNNTGATINLNSDSDNNKCGVYYTTFDYLETGYRHQTLKVDIADGEYKVLNSVNYRGLDRSNGIFYIETNASVDGKIELYLENTVDGTVWPSDYDDFEPSTDAVEITTATLSTTRKKVGQNFHL